VFRSERYPAPWKLSGRLPPPRIETPRLVLRCWEPANAPHFESALRVNRKHIGAWIPPAWDEPSELAAIERRLSQFQSEFHAGIGFVYAIFDPSEEEVLGEAGLMPRLGPRTLEIGYWVHADHVGIGLATEATRALTNAGLALPDVDRIEIHCDSANAPSAAVPRKLGYHLMPRPDQRAVLVFTLEGGDAPSDSSAGQPDDA
jgi:RimJ/RimL family protein N-acetyltransferase